MKTRSTNQSGSIIVSILAVMMFLTVIIYSLLVLANVNLTRARGRVLLLQAQYSAESGADAAIAIINNTNPSYAGTTSDVEVVATGQYKGTYEVTVSPGANNKEKIITATGKVYAPKNAATPRFVRKVEVIAQQTSSTGATSVLSRNIIEIASSVKTVNAVDVYVNNYINLAKNTNDLVAENITVGGRNTSAGNCSIGGTGKLSKPASFTTPGQTKTSIKMAYNNCITPPGNTSDSDFDVLANQNNINRITSTYIPWGAYMDSSYQDSPSGCSDWTTGSWPRDIPSTGNTKKTHYPDSSNGISTSCGTSGDLQLGNTGAGSTGTYNIRDHAHIRASLCAATACHPTFNNPDVNDIKFVFIEGTINFGGLKTTAGSGPIVFIAYGADPASKTGSCPTGGAVFLGNDMNTNAPAAYLLANNGLCLYQSKFDSDNALGGLSGKNLYIATNSGTPWDLRLNPSFPAGSIPVDLSWKAVLYRRL